MLTRLRLRRPVAWRWRALRLKNFITVDEALQSYSPSQLRFLFLLRRYSDPMECVAAGGAGALRALRACLPPPAASPSP